VKEIISHYDYFYEMQLTKEKFLNLLPSLRLASENLKGSVRRMFLGQLALDLGRGGRLLVSRSLKISRQTLRKGIREIQSGEVQKDKFHERGRKPLTVTNPSLLSSIKKIVDGASQTDPQFKSTRLYTRLSPKEVRTQLIKQDYKTEDLPCKATIGNAMKLLGYKRRKVGKTKPKKKIKETNAIFNQLDKEHKQAAMDSGILRISYDAKNRVAIGNFSRGGKNWTKVEACDHDFGASYITPFGFYLPEFQETSLYFTESKVTADFIVDVLFDFWRTHKKRFAHIHTLLLNADNGPECHSRRTQFIKRICEFAKENNIVVKLAYYPPYHSKYNPVERVWGGLEQHWNADILDTRQTVLNFAKTFVWAAKKATVKLWEGVYENGKKLSNKAMKLHEKAIDRLDDIIGKWFITINPEKVKEVLFSG